MTTKIAILLFDDVDLLDSGGPYEVFLTASRLAARDGNPELFKVMSATLDGEPVRSYGGMGLIPTHTLAQVMTSDVLIVPGTIDIEKAANNKELVNVIAEFGSKNPAESSSIVASVCTGAFLLARAGLITDQNWTTHWEDVDLLAEQLGVTGAVKDKRWVDSGTIVTAAALSSGIDMSLHMVERFAGRDMAERTARQIDYRWNEARP